MESEPSQTLKETHISSVQFYEGKKTESSYY